MDKNVDIYELMDMDIPPSAAHRARMRTRTRNLERRPDRHWPMDDAIGRYERYERGGWDDGAEGPA